MAAAVAVLAVGLPLAMAAPALAWPAWSAPPRGVAGGVLLIFPEGTRSTPGQPLQLQRGAANIAVRCRADLRLVHILCRPGTLTKQVPWYRIPPSRPHFQVSIREKIAIDPFVQDVASPAVAARQLTQFLTKALLPRE